MSCFYKRLWFIEMLAQESLGENSAKNTSDYVEYHLASRGTLRYTISHFADDDVYFVLYTAARISQYTCWRTDIPQCYFLFRKTRILLVRPKKFLCFRFPLSLIYTCVPKIFIEYWNFLFFEATLVMTKLHFLLMYAKIERRNITIKIINIK